MYFNSYTYLYFEMYSSYYKKNVYLNQKLSASNSLILQVRYDYLY